MHPTPRAPVLLLLVLPLLALAGCGGDEGGGASTASAVPAPLPAGEDAYALAGEQALPEAQPDDAPDLHNVFRLSDNIVSGGEPHGEEALAKIAAMGVKTVLSVDGKAPDHEAAARYGMRYVHVPIHYSGISADERLRIAKTFRELEGPFYVHCFHGKHRGPAAAALGRVVLDGVPREQAIAEMRQWMGTSKKYGGLYETIARAPLPDEADTQACPFDFAPAHEFKGFRHAMIEISRIFDHLEALNKRSWEVDPNHPDLNAANEAEGLLEAFRAAAAMEETRDKPEDYRTWLGESAETTEALLMKLREFTSADAASEAFAAVKARCDACHKVYRNN